MFTIINMKHLELCYLQPVKTKKFFLNDYALFLIVFVCGLAWSSFLVDKTLSYNCVKLTVVHDEKK